MRLALSEEQARFGAALDDLLGAAGVPDAARRWAAGDHAPGLALWRRLADVGVTALAVPERSGGLDAAPADLVVACEALGYHAVPGPVAETVAAVPTLLGDLDDARWLPALASGDLLATLAAPPQLPYPLDAAAAGLVLVADPSSMIKAWRPAGGLPGGGPGAGGVV
ncbi:acyl-CoA dehydrogenase family protein, partial [Actinomycetes bacterium KLBMP 9797]